VQAFGMNTAVQLAIHPLIPLSLLCPLVTGFIMGWRLRVTRSEGLVLATGMTTLLLAVIAIVTLVLAVVAPALEPITMAGVAVLLGLHLWLFAAVGAVLGGHYARKDPATLGLNA
jgi:hypothetical protein